MRRLVLTVAALALCVGVTGPQAGAAGSVTVSNATLFPATSGVFYGATFVAAGGTAPYAFSLAGGALPKGLSLAADGRVGGIPDAAPGLYSFTVQAVDGKGATGTATFTLVLATPTIVLSAALPRARVGERYLHALSATGGSPRYVFSRAAGSLPAGLGLASDGVLSGLPRAAGVWLFTVQATDRHGVHGTQTFRFVVRKARAIPKKTRPRAR
jgi:hypothetical protein